jgi:peptidoglycan/xylan/chitin deacetylase (PgdA/CDA1 family)
MIRLRVPVLMFHHVEATAAAGLSPPPLFPDSYLARSEFAAVLDALAAHGCRTLTLAEAAARRRAGRRLPRRAVVLTFDDGCRCFRDQALPELAARGMTATLFAVSAELGGSNFWDRPPGGPGERREELLGAAELREVAAAGIEVGSHGRRHRDLTACDAAALADEVAGSRDELAAALGRPVATFCYPYGRLDERARAAAERTGYAAAAGIHGVSAARRGDPFALPRMAVNPGDSRLELLLKASGAYPFWSRLPRLGLLRALRRRGGGTAARPAAHELDGRREGPAATNSGGAKAAGHPDPSGSARAVGHPEPAGGASGARRVGGAER